MVTLPRRCRVAKREPETPLRLEIAPGVIAAHTSQTVVILEPINGSDVRVRDVATGSEKVVPVGELGGAALGLSRKCRFHFIAAISSIISVSSCRRSARAPVGSYPITLCFG